MSEYIEQLEACEKEYDHLIELFTQADQSIQQAMQSAGDFNAEHGHHAPSAAKIMEALRDIQHQIHALTDQRNTVVASIAEAKAEAQKALDESPL